VSHPFDYLSDHSPRHCTAEGESSQRRRLQPPGEAEAHTFNTHRRSCLKSADLLTLTNTTAKGFRLLARRTWGQKKESLEGLGTPKGFRAYSPAKKRLRRGRERGGIQRSQITDLGVRIDGQTKDSNISRLYE